MKVLRELGNLVRRKLAKVILGSALGWVFDHLMEELVRKTVEGVITATLRL